MAIFFVIFQILAATGQFRRNVVSQIPDSANRLRSFANNCLIKKAVYWALYKANSIVVNWHTNIVVGLSTVSE